MGFLFVWYFVYSLCGQIRTVTVKIYPASYGLPHLARWGLGILRLPSRAVLEGEANAHLKESNKEKLQEE
jgi:hypothetical protein